MVLSLWVFKRRDLRISTPHRHKQILSVTEDSSTEVRAGSFCIKELTPRVRLMASVQHEGKYSYKITNKSICSPNVYARITQMVSGLRPFTTYKVSCWVKGKGCGHNWIGGGQGWYTRTVFPEGDFDWRQVVFEMETGAEPENYELMSSRAKA